ncbi:ATP-binding protein [Peptococcus simiae]|uniref:ATP-binding protein n=1 Tax=Peptococcus simiae TaxID=1643805 RepID=UPI00397FD4D0
MYKRKIYDQLLDWKKTSAGQTALLIEGARRVGKSTIVEAFGKKEYRSYILIDFAFAPKSVQALFEDMSDLDYFFLQLQLQYGVDLHERNSLIIFDEVQFNPLARQSIKRLVADGRYDYIETGSLISIKKNIAHILVPSEERKIEMFPMDFEEFLWATGDETTMPLLEKAFRARISLGEAQNRQLMRKFRLYMLVGGMPQAVQAYMTSNNFRLVDQVKRDMVHLYEEDFYKIDPSGKISMLYDAVPAELAKHSTRYQVSSVLENGRASEILEEIAELQASKTVLLAYQSTDPHIGLAGHIHLDRFKIYLADTGLMVTLMFKDRQFTENTVYRKLLNDKLPANLGFLYENVVAQSLAAKGHHLFYHSYYDQVQKRSFELDFLLTCGEKICPVEVKSSNYRKHRSLDAFSSKYAGRIANRYVIHTKDLKRVGGIDYLPFYMAQFL